jgi:molybdopterin-guanine dinucleotide biosynthesis protein A
MKIIGAIIAGGQSRRMGAREKAFLKLAGKPILSHVIERMGPQVDRLSSMPIHPVRFSEFGLTIIPDALTTLTTPLAGCMRRWICQTVAADVLVTVPPTHHSCRMISSKDFGE